MKRIFIIIIVLVVWLSAAVSAQASIFDKPALNNPTVVDLSSTAATTYNDSYRFSSTQDVILKCSKNPVIMPHWFEVSGGHNIVMENCDIVLQSSNGSPSRAFHLKNNNGTVWVHDVHFEPGIGQYLFEGIDLDEPDTTDGANIVFRDILIDGMHGTDSSHADAIQTWRGPKRFVIDGATFYTDYQGLFLLPDQWDNQSTPLVWDFRNIDLVQTGGKESFWLGNLTEPMIPTWNVQNLYSNDLHVWDGTGSYGPCGCGPAWNNARQGLTPSGGHFVWKTDTGAFGADDPTPIALLPGE